MNTPRNRDQLFGVIAGLLCRAGSFEDTADVCRNPAANPAANRCLCSLFCNTPC